jgi:hypothetical protein
MIRIILRSWWMKLLMSAAVAAGMGLGIGLWVYARLYEEFYALRFEQSEIDLRQSPAIEGDPIDVVARLHNYGKIPLRILQMTSS